MKIKVIIAAHKQYLMPDKDCYLPVQVGSALHKAVGYTPDNTGDNISEKNPYYCELTGLYWAWKNLPADVIGLVHYRRYMGKKNGIVGLIQRYRDPLGSILDGKDIEKLMEKSDIILPKKRKYYIETLYSHYAHTHYAEHLDITREVLTQLCPEYVPAFDRVMKRTSGHMFNMFIMKREKCNAYCEFLFPVIGEIEKQIDVTKLSSFHARVFGRISELLLDVWIEANRESYVEAPLVNIEKTNWGKKGSAFLKAKFEKKKYEGSF